MPVTARGRERGGEAGRGASAPSELVDGTDPDDTWLWTSSPQSCERIRFCCFKPPRLQNLVPAALGNKQRTNLSPAQPCSSPGPAQPEPQPGVTLTSSPRTTGGGLQWSPSLTQKVGGRSSEESRSRYSPSSLSFPGPQKQGSRCCVESPSG